MALSSFVKFLIKGKTTMIREEITEQTIKAIPAVGGATLGKASDIAILQDLEKQIEIKRNELRKELN